MNKKLIIAWVVLGLLVVIFGIELFVILHKDNKTEELQQMEIEEIPNVQEEVLTETIEKENAEVADMPIDDVLTQEVGALEGGHEVEYDDSYYEEKAFVESGYDLIDTADEEEIINLSDVTFGGKLTEDSMSYLLLIDFEYAAVKFCEDNGIVTEFSSDPKVDCTAGDSVNVVILNMYSDEVNIKVTIDSVTDKASVEVIE